MDRIMPPPFVWNECLQPCLRILERLFFGAAARSPRGWRLPTPLSCGFSKLPGCTGPPRSGSLPFLRACPKNGSRRNEADCCAPLPRKIRLVTSAATGLWEFFRHGLSARSRFLLLLREKRLGSAHPRRIMVLKLCGNPEQQLAIGPLRSKNPAWTGRHYENRQTRQTDKE